MGSHACMCTNTIFKATFSGGGWARAVSDLIAEALPLYLRCFVPGSFHDKIPGAATLGDK